MPSAAGVHRDSTSAVDGISALLEHQRKAFLRDGPPSLRQRRTDLAKLKHAIQASANRIADVISDDFGSRSRHERLMAEVLSVCAAIRHASHHLPRWMRPKHVSVNLELRPGRARILYQPVGVVDHQPVELSISPCDNAAHLGTRSWQSGDAEAIGTNASDGTVYRHLLADLFTPEQVAPPVFVEPPASENLATCLCFRVKSAAKWGRHPVEYRTLVGVNRARPNGGAGLSSLGRVDIAEWVTRAGPRSQDKSRRSHCGPMIYE